MWIPPPVAMQSGPLYPPTDAECSAQDKRKIHVDCSYFPCKTYRIRPNYCTVCFSFLGFFSELVLKYILILVHYKDQQSASLGTYLMTLTQYFSFFIKRIYCCYLFEWDCRCAGWLDSARDCSSSCEGYHVKTCWGYSLGMPQQDASNEYLQHTFFRRNKKIYQYLFIFLFLFIYYVFFCGC